ncbi:MAG: energy-coupling factor transporter ATPase [Lachnospiraceae bacterium]|nr:energy-coupling factor transporter ATPase [Lachnospiraceae bacterium]
MEIKLENVTYLYEKGTAMQTAALQDVSLVIPDNQFIGLIGHTGSGKSTLVQLLNGLLKPTEGRVLYNGEDINGEGFDKRALRSKVGLVFQYPEHQLFEVDVLSDVMYGPRNLGLDEKTCRERAMEALESVGMPEEYYKTSPFDLSGGQKRRAAIAGVLAMHPRVLILDEPTAGLDPRGRDEILNLISGMKQKLNMTIILVTHSMDDVARYVERIVVMGHGKKVFDDIPRHVFYHHRELEELGLSAPQITYIMRAVREVGIDVKTDALTVEEAAEEVLRALSGHKGRARE